jgi:DNA-binding NarL/FixJ family response regulator
MSSRTRDVLALRARGFTLDQIARHLAWSRRTVITEIGQACATLGARNACHAVYLATLAGII